MTVPVAHPVRCLVGRGNATLADETQVGSIPASEHKFFYVFIGSQGVVGPPRPEQIEAIHNLRTTLLRFILHIAHYRGLRIRPPGHYSIRIPAQRVTSIPVLLIRRRHIDRAQPLPHTIIRFLPRAPRLAHPILPIPTVLNILREPVTENGNNADIPKV
ncbi:hypothetical protein BBAD15_g12151 [Beauveria bassiana D1-5]|uniref:Uncharacterized protein n=1 Tax=Beauveria bassiana D1-5 TaxID=1245745 RepID=A0A0A2V8J5_BEABA|nr:hypothetical protein BBAD15_g12151 [Beauveria bassiana D1-5]